MNILLAGGRGWNRAGFEGVQSWFDTNQGPRGGIHNEVDTREELKAYDLALAALMEEFFGDGSWRPLCPNG